MNLPRWLTRPWRRQPVRVICARVGESLAPPAGSVLALCQACRSEITIAPLTFRQLWGRRFETVCVQCEAAAHPDAPMGPMGPEAVAQFVRGRGALPAQPFRTLGEYAVYHRALFPGEPKEPTVTEEDAEAMAQRHLDRFVRQAATRRIVAWLDEPDNAEFREALAAADRTGGLPEAAARMSLLNQLNQFTEKPGSLQMGLHVTLIEIALGAIDWPAVLDHVAAPR